MHICRNRRSYTDSAATLEGNAEATSWSDKVPKKICVFLWRLRKERLPVRVLLDRRGIDIPSLLCPLCQESIENIDHVFVRCRISKEIWMKLFFWWGINDPNCVDVSQLISSIGNHQWRIESKEVWKLTVWCFLYLIWKYRNMVVFENITRSSTELFLEFQWRTFLWLKARCKNFKMEWLVWRMDPVAVRCIKRT